jgi:ABC-type transporter Mla subunit MlaD
MDAATSRAKDAATGRGKDAAAERRSGAAAGRRTGATRRRWAAALAGAATVLALVLAVGAGGDGDDDAYLVRAVFDNASFVIPGEDVKVAGVKVGVIHDVDLTEDNKAAVVLKIEDPAFRPFRRDAHCRIGLQSLIGEQFVECQPTQPRGDGVPPAPPLPRIREGRGAGQHLLPVEQTTTPINVDLINNIMRLPERERFRIIINELGAGLAGNAEELSAAIRRASPALQQADRVVKTLAEQNELLDRLVEESDRVLEPMARRRKELAGFIDHAGRTAEATARQGEALERNLERLPAFLRELGPAAERFGALADQMEPAIRSLGERAPTINETVQRFGPMLREATPALETLGDVATRGRTTLPRIEKTIDELAALARPLRPAARDLAAVATSFDEQSGIEHLMRLIYYYTGAINGKDALGHYIRASIQVGHCVDRAPEPVGGCEATFDSSGGGDGAEAGAASVLADYLLGQEGGR